MNTPNLDRLLAQATQRFTSNTVESVLAHDDVCELMGTHATEIVGVLQYYAGTAIGVRAYDVLEKLEQEATCQK